jgi:hypothetical protein
MGDLATAMEISSAVIAELARAGYRDEYQRLCLDIARRIREGSMPPDDAKAWVRALMYDARRLDLVISESCD